MFVPFIITRVVNYKPERLSHVLSHVSNIRMFEKKIAIRLFFVLLWFFYCYLCNYQAVVYAIMPTINTDVCLHVQ